MATAGPAAVGVSLDAVTDRSKVEDQKLRVSEARFRTIFEQANDFRSRPRSTLTASLLVNPAVVEAIIARTRYWPPIRDFMDEDQFAIGMGVSTAASAIRRLDAADAAARARRSELIWEVICGSARAVGRPWRCDAIGAIIESSAPKRIPPADRSNQPPGEEHARHRAGHRPAELQRSMCRWHAQCRSKGRLAALSEAHNRLLTREHWGLVRCAGSSRTPCAHGELGLRRFALDGLTIDPAQDRDQFGWPPRAGDQCREARRLPRPRGGSPFIGRERAMTAPRSSAALGGNGWPAGGGADVAARPARRVERPSPPSFGRHGEYRFRHAGLVWSSTAPLPESACMNGLRACGCSSSTSRWSPCVLEDLLDALVGETIGSGEPVGHRRVYGGRRRLRRAILDINLGGAAPPRALAHAAPRLFALPAAMARRRKGLAKTCR